MLVLSGTKKAKILMQDAGETKLKYPFVDEKEKDRF
jgi:hypothetical protein